MKGQYAGYSIHREILLISLWLALVVGACSNLPTPEVKSKGNWHCIPPIVKYGYSVSATAESDFPVKVPPRVTEGWVRQLSPQQQEDLGSIWSLVYYSGDIWMTTGSAQLARFYLGEGELTFYKVKVDEQSEFVPDELFVSSDRELWGIGNIGVGDNVASWPSINGKFRGILSRYDPRMDRFLPVIDQDNLLVGTVGEVSIDDDSQGNLWVALADKTVAHFDPDTLKAEIVLDHKSGYKFYDIAVDPGGRIWLSAEPIRELMEGESGIASELVLYDPNSDELRSFGIPPGWEALNHPFPLYMDRQGRIWADAAWLEKTDEDSYEWYALAPQPEFVLARDYGLPEISVAKYVVGSPNPVFEASDGSIWFSGAGLLRLDPESGEWCRITEGYTFNIIEDDVGNLWIADGTQLYKKSLKP